MYGSSLSLLRLPGVVGAPDICQMSGLLSDGLLMGSLCLNKQQDKLDRCIGQVLPANEEVERTTSTLFTFLEATGCIG